MTGPARGYARIAMREIAELRRAGIAAGTWPAHSTELWRALARRARLVTDRPLAPAEREAMLLFPDEANP